MHNAETKRAAWGMYLRGEGTIPEIAVKLGVPESSVKSWHYRGKWASKKQEGERSIEQELRQDQLRALRHQLEVYEMAVEVLHMELELRIKHLEAGLFTEPVTLVKLAQALKTSADAWESFERGIKEGKPVNGIGNALIKSAHNILGMRERSADAQYQRPK